MTVPDDSQPPRASGRRALGRGPGTAPGEGAVDVVPVHGTPGDAPAPPAAEEEVLDTPEPPVALPPAPESAVAPLGPAGVRDRALSAEPAPPPDPPEPAQRRATEAAEAGGAGPAALLAEPERPAAGSDPGPAPEPQPQPQPQAQAQPQAGPAGVSGTDETTGRFTLRLANFEGPFDLLLQLISKHKLDVTEIALSKVTDEFMAHIRAMGPDWDLDQTTEFLVVAATLLDLKAARLLPAAEVEDEEDLALLEARDLLFARLLQYRAYKQIAAIFASRLEAEALYYPRTVGLEPQHAELLPEVVLSVGPERFVQLAVKAMQPKPKPQVYVDHIHAPLVSVREQAEHVIALLRERGEASFQELTADAADTLTVVARFLALLELYREKAVALDQEEALGTLQVRWTGGEGDAGRPLVTDEFDEPVKDGPVKPMGKDGRKDGRDDD